MRRTLSGWIERKIAERFGDPFHECELCGDIDDATTHAPLSTGEVVCWHCAERAGEFKVWASTGLTDIQHQGHSPGKDVHNGDHGEEEAASAPLVHSGVQG